MLELPYLLQAIKNGHELRNGPFLCSPMSALLQSSSPVREAVESVKSSHYTVFSVRWKSNGKVSDTNSATRSRANLSK